MCPCSSTRDRRQLQCRRAGEGHRSPEVAGYRYAYAPSIVREGETIHIFYCSLGVITGKEGNSHGGGDGIDMPVSTTAEKHGWRRESS